MGPVGPAPHPGLAAPYLIPNPADYPCPRCTRAHPGGHDKCKSVDKLCANRICLAVTNRICRKCNNFGHFTEVHDITEPGFRQLIVNTLGINLWGDWEYLSAQI